MMRARWLTHPFLVLLTAIVSLASILPASAAIPTNDFSLEVSPSPLVATVKPGTTTTLELKIHNASTKTEQLVIRARPFSFKTGTSDITISERTPPTLAQEVNFSEPTFTLQANEWKTQKVMVTLPESAGFSYSFAVVIARENEVTTPGSSQTIRGSVAVFTLLNIDKPGATRALTARGIKPEQSIYEYLPATLNLTFQNTGNTIVQPYGNVYIGRSADDTDPVSVLPLNPAGGYMLPGMLKKIDIVWNEGFPHYEAGPPDKNGQPTQRLVWDWSQLSKFRFGRYTAKVVAVYNDGTRDVPVIGEVSFWVIPWRILLGALVVIALIVIGFWSLTKQLTRRMPRLRRRRR